MSSAHSPSFQSLHLRHSSFWFSKLSVTSPTSQLILQPFHRFTYVTTHSPTLPLLHLRHKHFKYVTAHSPTILLLLLRHRIFTYVTWRAAHAKSKQLCYFMAYHPSNLYKKKTNSENIDASRNHKDLSRPTFSATF